MRIPKDDIPAKIDVPGVVARQLPDFGVADGTMGAEYFSLGAGGDLAPLLVGLDGDACQAPHWGYMIEGEVTVDYTDGATERCRTGELFYWPPGHSVRVDADTDMILFSPQVEHTHVLDHILDKMTAV
jgi:hypothetical protein